MLRSVCVSDIHPATPFVAFSHSWRPELPAHVRLTCQLYQTTIALDAQGGAHARQGSLAPLRAPCYWVTTTGPQAMGDASMKLLRFVPRVTTTYQAVLGADDTLPITVVLVALPELSPVSGLSPKTFWVD